jgi:hypothetical protein
MAQDPIFGGPHGGYGLATLSSVDQILAGRPELERRGVLQVLACGLASTRGRCGARTADLAEVKDWVEGLRAATHNAPQVGNITLAEALDITRFEVYESYLDEEYTNKRAKRLMIKN